MPGVEWDVDNNRCVLPNGLPVAEKQDMAVLIK
jgi:hypothetical protein